MRNRRFRATSAVAPENDSPGASRGEASDRPLGTSAIRDCIIPPNAGAGRQTLADRRIDPHRLARPQARPQNAILRALKRTVCCKCGSDATSHAAGETLSAEKTSHGQTARRDGDHRYISGSKASWENVQTTVNKRSERKEKLQDTENQKSTRDTDRTLELFCIP